MSCTEIEILLAQASQNELPPGEAARLQRHLAGCPGCRRTLAELRQVWQMLDAWKVPEPPAHLARSFSSRLAQETVETSRVASLLQKLDRPSPRGTWLRLGWNLAGLALAASVVFGAIYLFHSPSNAPDTLGPRTRLITDGSSNRGQTRTTLANERSSEAVADGTARVETSAPTAPVPLNRLAPDGVAVESLADYRQPAGQVHFAVHNFPTNVPEINIKHYNTVAALYEDSF